MKNTNKWLYFCMSLVFFVSFVFINNKKVFAKEYTSAISTYNTISEDIKATLMGKTTIIQQKINVKSDNPSGFRLYISSKNDKNVPVRVGELENSVGFSSVTGNIEFPSKLSNNNFGFGIAKDTENQLSNNFSEESIYTSNDRDIYNNAKFAKIGSLNNLVEFYRTDNPTENKDIKIFYGLKTNITMTKGVYTMDIVYTLIPNLSGDNGEIINIEEKEEEQIKILPNILPKNESRKVEINTNIKTNLDFNKENISVLIGEKECSNINIIQKSIVLGNEGNYSAGFNKSVPLILSCDLPAMPESKYNVKLKISKNGKSYINLEKNNAISYQSSSLNKISYMQDENLVEACENTYENDTGVLRDKRDNETYRIVKLKDGKCWMVQNLRLKLNTNKTLTPEDSDVVRNWTPNRNTEISNSNIGTNWYNEDVKKTKSIYFEPSYGTNGVYYSYNTAIADSYIGEKINKKKATASICPKGWRLPNISNNKEENEGYNLVKHYKGNLNADDNSSFNVEYNEDPSAPTPEHDLFKLPVNFIKSGSFNDGEFMYQDFSFNIWYSNIDNQNKAYRMEVIDDMIMYNSSDIFNDGQNIRCVLRDDRKIISMQDFNMEMCNKLSEHQTINLIDKRDRETYTVTKLKDGKCWMTENLRLILDPSIKLTSKDSDTINDWTPNRATEIKNNIRERGTDWSLENNNISKSIFAEPRYNDFGVYYSYDTATLGNYTGEEIDRRKANISICPKGWRLPNAEANKSKHEGYNLMKHYRGNLNVDDNRSFNVEYNENPSAPTPEHDLFKLPVNFVKNGLYENGEFIYDYFSTYFWYSNVNLNDRNKNNAYITELVDDIINYDINRSRNNGISVRCVLKEKDEVKFMQDFNMEMCNKLSEHQTINLIDKRDAESYTVTKLKDGKCWMTENLRLKLNVNNSLTPNDTDIIENWTPNRNTELAVNQVDMPGYGSGEIWMNTEINLNKSIYKDIDYYKYGVYYSYSSATANSYKGEIIDGKDAPYSICPKGWKLPNSKKPNYSDDLWLVSRAYKGGLFESADEISDEENYSFSGLLHTDPANFVKNGFYNDSGQFELVNEFGGYQSSTISNNDVGYNYRLEVDDNYLRPRTNSKNNQGYGIKCVLK